MQKGLQLVVDGTEPELVREMLEARSTAWSSATRRRDTFEKAGGFAPTMGIIGTVMALVHVLRNLSDPGSLGPAISARSSPRCSASAPRT